ncbi:hypothetical protein [Novosphingobium sp. AP12]|uniref:hypothetical protein n=1 Tax=Novosphingobium sp. AP12 TaxID=1144305 RepID=UPI0002721EE6|nr:hypothetical protein [Novosphingobium sp. AP12]EJL30095.1 hypothetical protein PMI02_02154 [Novosphingobium sp. AP12]
MNRTLRPDPFEAFVWSPHQGTLVSLYRLRDDWDHVAEIDASLIGRAEAWFLYANYLWVLLAIALGLSLPILAGAAFWPAP